MTREEIDKLDVSREEERPGGDTAKVILGVEEAELHRGTAPGVSSYEVAKLSHDVASHLHHVLMHCLGLQSLAECVCVCVFVSFPVVAR